MIILLKMTSNSTSPGAPERDHHLSTKIYVGAPKKPDFEKWDWETNPSGQGLEVYHDGENIDGPAAKRLKISPSSPSSSPSSWCWQKWSENKQYRKRD